MSPQLPVKAISERELRLMFNEGQYHSRTTTGELWEDVLQSPHATPARSGEPVCTYSQLVAYREISTGRKVAIVHQYLRPDGTVGASGKPDPKWLLVGDCVYVPTKLSTPADT